MVQLHTVAVAQALHACGAATINSCMGFDLHRAASTRCAVLYAQKSACWLDPSRNCERFQRAVCHRG